MHSWRAQRQNPIDVCAVNIEQNFRTLSFYEYSSFIVHDAESAVKFIPAFGKKKSFQILIKYLPMDTDVMIKKILSSSYN